MAHQIEDVLQQSHFAWPFNVYSVRVSLRLRDGYREERRRATARLGHLYLQAVRSQEAAVLFQRLLEAEPLLEDVVQELYRCYEQIGDLGPLLAADRALRDALARLYRRKDVEPGHETVALFNEIRVKLEGKVHRVG